MLFVIVCWGRWNNKAFAYEENSVQRVFPLSSNGVSLSLDGTASPSLILYDRVTMPAFLIE